MLASKAVMGIRLTFLFIIHLATMIIIIGVIPKIIIQNLLLCLIIIY